MLSTKKSILVNVATQLSMQHHQEKRTLKVKEVEQQNNLATFFHARRKLKGSGSKISLISAVSDEKIIHRTNAVTACLQAGLPVAMMNLIPMIPNIVYSCHSLDNKCRDSIMIIIYMYTIQS